MQWLSFESIPILQLLIVVYQFIFPLFVLSTMQNQYAVGIVF